MCAGAGALARESRAELHLGGLLLHGARSAGKGRIVLALALDDGLAGSAEAGRKFAKRPAVLLADFGVQRQDGSGLGLAGLRLLRPAESQMARGKFHEGDGELRRMFAVVDPTAEIDGRLEHG